MIFSLVYLILYEFMKTASAVFFVYIVQEMCFWAKELI